MLCFDLRPHVEAKSFSVDLGAAALFGPLS
jgi:hypothetical protein